MSAPAAWEREARILTRYVARLDATPWLVERYARALELRPQLVAATTFDRWQAWVATRHPLLTLLMDAPGVFAAPRSALRRKLILITALLEIAPGMHPWFDAAPGGVARQALHLAARGVAVLAALVVGAPLLAAMAALAALTPVRR